MLLRPQFSIGCGVSTPGPWLRIGREREREREHTASWDTAKQGSNAMWPALARALKGELVSGAGKTFGGSLWDLHKLFDLVDPVSFVKKAISLGFPIHGLAMGIQMHVAPRALQLLGACSGLIDVCRSVLAGCGLAIPFARVYLGEEMDRVQAGTPGAEQPVYVDDISQAAMGTVDAVVGALVDGGIRFRDAIYWLHLGLP